MGARHRFFLSHFLLCIFRSLNPQNKKQRPTAISQTQNTSTSAQIYRTNSVLKKNIFRNFFARFFLINSNKPVALLKIAKSSTFFWLGSHSQCHASSQCDPNGPSDRLQTIAKPINHTNEQDLHRKNDIFYLKIWRLRCAYLAHVEVLRKKFVWIIIRHLF